MLRRFLPTVISNTPPDVADIIVADNGSTDNSLEVLSTEFPSVKVIALDTNYGFAEGYNRAIAGIKGYEYVVLLNSDVAPDKGWLPPLLNLMQQNHDIGACQPKIHSVDNPNQFEYAGAAGGFLDRNGYPYCRGRIFSTVEKDNGQYDDTIEVDWASGACLLIRRDLYLKAGGLDASFFAHMEEIDLCWRLWRLGYKVCAVGSASVKHLGGGSLPMGSPRKTYLNFRNNLLLLRKNLPHKGRKGKLIKRRLLDTIALFKELATFHPRQAAAIFKAHRHYSAMARKLETERHDSTMPPLNLLAQRPNIITQYYLRGRKLFSRLTQ